MYAIETKKRKFDRILDSIKDHSGTPSTNSLTPRNNNTSTISLLIADSPTGSVKKARTSSAAASSLNHSTTSLANHKTASYLPTSREAFLDRLETFGPITKWHVASNEPINAAAWAKRGWRCVDTDTVSCPSCGERLLVKIEDDIDGIPSTSPAQIDEASMSLEESEDDAYMAAEEVHAGMVAKYQEMITSAHSEGCPWRHRGCIESIQRIEGLLNAPTTLAMVQTRYESMVSAAPAPDIPKTHIETGDGIYAAIMPSLFGKIRSLDPKPDESAYLLAICGWQRAIDGGSDVIECRHCFRHLGLWLYRGQEPTMEKLDAVESHLDYCPWRSPEAQATEIDLQGKKIMVPGWFLVAQTVERQKVKPTNATSTTSAPGECSSPLPHGSAPYMDDPVNAEIGEKQRDKKIKDLLRKVKELKKPFNVKALLKKNKKPS